LSFSWFILLLFVAGDQVDCPYDLMACFLYDDIAEALDEIYENQDGNNGHPHQVCHMPLEAEADGEVSETASTYRTCYDGEAD